MEHNTTEAAASMETATQPEVSIGVEMDIASEDGEMIELGGLKAKYSKEYKSNTPAGKSPKTGGLIDCETGESIGTLAQRFIAYNIGGSVVIHTEIDGVQSDKWFSENGRVLYVDGGHRMDSGVYCSESCVRIESATKTNIAGNEIYTLTTSDGRTALFDPTVTPRNNVLPAFLTKWSHEVRTTTDGVIYARTNRHSDFECVGEIEPTLEWRIKNTHTPTIPEIDWEVARACREYIENSGDTLVSELENEIERAWNMPATHE